MTTTTGERMYLSTFLSFLLDVCIKIYIRVMGRESIVKRSLKIRRVREREENQVG